MFETYMKNDLFYPSCPVCLSRQEQILREASWREGGSGSSSSEWKETATYADEATSLVYQHLRIRNPTQPLLRHYASMLVRNDYHTILRQSGCYDKESP
jgi:hypothetical protein